MKKLTITIFLIFVLLMCTVACDNGGQNPSDTGAPTQSQDNSSQGQEPSQAVYGVLNSLTQKSYDKVTLDITTKTQADTLHATYVLTASNVTYSIEQLNLLPSEGNIENMSPSYKKMLSGTAAIENGTVTAVDGEAVKLPSYDELKGNFNFQESNFKNVVVNENSFCADVISASALIGSEKELNDVKILVEYDTSALRKITITYNTSNATVTSVYTFEN